MKVLIIGTGGREHAIAKALSKSKEITIYAIGEWINPGIAHLGTVETLDINNPKEISRYARNKDIDLAIIGSENQLEQGVADVLNAAGVFCIGPNKNNARLETDKTFARKIINPTYNPRYKVFYSNNYSLSKLKKWLKDLKYNYVIKAVGLRGGKGVKVSDIHLKHITQAHKYCEELLAQDGKVLVEERLFGEEFTILGFSDGKSMVNMPPIRDFKRLKNGDTGPNTGGMGCVSFGGFHAPFLDKQDIEIANEINRQTISKLSEEYVGIVYGSFMKTEQGIKVIEYNCRFGDPEAINALELLKTNFGNILKAMKNQMLHKLPVKWSKDAMVTNYIVAPGYPEKSYHVNLQIPEMENIIYGKIKCVNREYTQLGSRSIAVFSRAPTLCQAYRKNRKLLRLFRGLDCQYRTDIGKEWARNIYALSGVDIAKGEKVVKNIKSHVMTTWNENVKSDFGDFAGMYNLDGNMLVTSTDGVGTKTIATLQVLGPDRGFRCLGQDIVNHCVNDILVKGAEPLFFLDYIASSTLNADHITSFVSGASKACKTSGCVLIGGETAEMPDVYNDGHVDIVGTIVGVIKNQPIDGPSSIKEGDLIFGLQSSGPHTNGYSLIRKVIKDLKPQDIAPHRCYLEDIRRIQTAGIHINALCHITGGGWKGNLSRVLPDGLGVDIKVPRPPADSIFTRVYKTGISSKEMLNVFNMGFGMLIFVSPNDKEKLITLFEGDYLQQLGIVTKSNSLNIKLK